MCGCPEMESYEEFCLRSLATLQEEGKLQRMTCEPPCSLQARSLICFYGRAVLSPLLSAEQRSEMCGHRERAVRQEAKRQNRQRHKLLAQIQDILDQTQTQKVLSEEAEKVHVSKSASGYTLVTDVPGLLRDPGCEPQPNDRPPTPRPETPSLSWEKSERSDEEEDISLDSLLKKSREYVKREQSRQQGSNVTRTATFETVSDKENKSHSPVGNAGVEFGFSLHHSPIGTPQTQIPHQHLYDPSLQHPGCLSPGLPDRYARLPSPESSVSPCARRRRPRPVSTGNIHISFPIGPADLVPRSPGRSDREDSLTGHWGLGWSEGGSNVSNSPAHEACSPVSPSVPGRMGHHDRPGAGFRRRCHTLDSQLHPYPSGAEHIDRSQERVPRFMAGVTWLAPSRRTPAAPLSQTDSPSLCLPRPLVAPDGAQITLRIERDDTAGPNNGNAPDQTEADSSEQPQRRVQALEDMQRRLEEEHALQMSLLLSEQEKEQQRLRLELEETARRMKERACLRPLSGEAYGWNCPGVSPSCPGLSPARTPSERSPGHTIGFPSPVSSSVSPPSVQPPVYVWGPTWAAGKPRARLSLVLTAQQQGAFSRLGAVTRGFLTRRLLKTEKVKHLRQTIADTQEFIRSFQTEAPQKKSSISAQDLSLEERVRAQLRAALYDIHDIFFEMPLGERLALLQQERELRAERKLRDLEKNKCVKERVVLSAATQRSLDRKKRVGESPAQTRKMQQKPKSPTTNRVLKPSQCQNSPVPGQLNRQGSWYRKTPEERVKRSDSLKKQHSLG